MNKYMDLSKLEKAIQDIRSHDMGVVLNVLLGAPFLSPEEQLEDSRKAVEWAVEHGADCVVIFPVNIRPNTLIWKLYQEGEYRPVSHWLLIELLSELNSECIERVELSWFGDRQEAGEALNVIPPVCCSECKPVLMQFYREFMSDFNASSRRGMIEMLKRKVCCKCQHKIAA